MQGESDQDLTHELLHALGFSTGVIITVTFKKVYNAPYTNACTDQADNALENGTRSRNERRSINSTRACCECLSCSKADAITPAIVQNMVAFFAPRVSLESHLCFGAEVVAAVSIAVASTAEIFSSFIGKKSPSKNKVKIVRSFNRFSFYSVSSLSELKADIYLFFVGSLRILSISGFCFCC